MPAPKLKVTFNKKVEIILKVNIILHFIVINSNFFFMGLDFIVLTSLMNYETGYCRATDKVRNYILKINKSH